MDGTGKLLHFAAGDRRFALPVAAIAEIRELQSITPVPGTPEAIAGLADIRGRVVTLLDLGRIFGLEPDPRSALLAVQLAEPLTHLALLVPTIVQSVRTDAGAGAGWQEAPLPPSGEWGGTSGSLQGLGREVILAGGEPVFLIDPAALIRHCVQRVRDRFRVSA